MNGGNTLHPLPSTRYQTSEEEAYPGLSSANLCTPLLQQTHKANQIHAQHFSSVVAPQTSRPRDFVSLPTSRPFMPSPFPHSPIPPTIHSFQPLHPPLKVNKIGEKPPLLFPLVEQRKEYK